ncbi:MAG: DMT family transporter [Anaerolineales bacterium]
MSAANWLLFLILGALWGSSFLWIKIAVTEIGPMALVGWRLLFGTLGMLAVFFFHRFQPPRDRRTWVNLLILGMINTAIPFFLISWGEQTVDSAVASVLNSTVPLFTLIIAHVYLADERINLPNVVGLSMGFGGVLLLMSRDLSAGVSVGLVGQFAILLAALLYAVGGVFARRTMSEVDPYTQAFIPMAAADLMVWSLALSVEQRPIVPELPLTWLALVWLGVLGSAFAYIIYFQLLHRIGATRSTMVTYLVALIGVMLGVVFLNETFDWRLAGGGAMVIAGIAVVNRTRASRESPTMTTNLKPG